VCVFCRISACCFWDCIEDPISVAYRWQNGDLETEGCCTTALDHIITEFLFSRVIILLLTWLLR
jgi:hypothetical protein